MFKAKLKELVLGLLGDSISGLECSLYTDSIYRQINKTVKKINTQISKYNEQLKIVKDKRRKLDKIETEMTNRVNKYKEVEDKMKNLIA